MTQKTVAEILVETLIAAGVTRIYGVVGDSLNGILEEIRRSKKIEWIGVRHEETGAFAAGAQAHLTGELAVCAGSCGPGNMHLINGLYDCHRGRVPVLAIAAQIPSQEIFSNYFQETHPDQLFRDCSHYCEQREGDYDPGRGRMRRSPRRTDASWPADSSRRSSQPYAVGNTSSTTIPTMWD